MGGNEKPPKRKEIWASRGGGKRILKGVPGTDSILGTPEYPGQVLNLKIVGEKSLPSNCGGKVQSEIQQKKEVTNVAGGV